MLLFFAQFFFCPRILDTVFDTDDTINGHSPLLVRNKKGDTMEKLNKLLWCWPF